MNREIDEFPGSVDGWWSILRVSAKAVPVNKLAIGVVGLGAAVAMLNFALSWKVAVFGILLMLSFMSLLLVLGWAKQYGRKDARPLISVFLWVTVITASLTVLVLFTTFAFGWPTHATRILYGPQEPVDPITPDVNNPSVHNISAIPAPSPVHVIAAPAPQAPSRLSVSGTLRVRVDASERPPNLVSFTVHQRFLGQDGLPIESIRPPTPILPISVTQPISMVGGRFVQSIEIPRESARRGPSSKTAYVYEMSLRRTFVIDGTNDEIWRVISQLNHIELDIGISPNQPVNRQTPDAIFPTVSSIQLELGGKLQIVSIDAFEASRIVLESHDGQAAWELPPLRPGAVRVASTNISVRSPRFQSFDLWRQFVPQ